MLALAILSTAIAVGDPAVQSLGLANLAVLRTTTRAFVLSDPEIALEPEIEQYSISPNGRYILAIQGEPVDEVALLRAGRPQKRELVLWDSSRKRKQTIARFPADASDRPAPTITWLGGTSTGLVVFYDSSTTMHLWFVNASSASIRRVKRTDADGAFFNASGSPTVPYALLANIRGRRGATTPWAFTVSFEALDAAGRVTGRLDYDENMVPPGKIFWSADGTRALIAAQRLSSTGGRRQIVLEIDPRTMTLVEHDGSVAVYQQTNRHEDMRIEQLPIDVQREDQAVFASATWLVSDLTGGMSQTFVAVGAKDAEISPSANYVAYRQSNALFVRRLNRLSAADLEAILAARRQFEAMSLAKRAMTAVVMFASDNNDRMPYASEFQAAVAQYFPNLEGLDGFQYLGNGEIMADIKDVAGTVMGYVRIDGGRVIAYADTRVVWEPDP
ncbi:MAG: hypothetical protein IH944_07465 [Armatimonadetes bacterium]|nr:hypothetical protein [Armatimonadota bacterium]